MSVHFLISTSSRAFTITQTQYEDVNTKNAIGIINRLIISINLQFKSYSPRIRV